MKRKMKISGKKVVSSCLVFAMMCQLVGSNNLIIANAENETDTDTKSYIVMADSSKEFDDLTSRAAYSILEENPELSDNNIAVMELSPEEVEEMQQIDGLIVEEDIIISANSMVSDLEEEVITEGTEAETVLTESESESQTVTEETVGTKETEITEKSQEYTETIGNTESFLQENSEDVALEDMELAKQREYFAKYKEAKNIIKGSEVKADWNLQAINADEINTNARSTAKVKVALLDSGVDIVNGVELAGWINLVEEEDYVMPVYQDLTGHGTGIASIICANGEGGIKGVNPNVDLYSVKVLNGENKAPLSRIVKGIYWCIDNDVNIINMSFGTSTYSNAMKKAVENAYDAGILMVGASGNNAGKVEYPAAFKEVMAVAATNTEAEISSFSNTGKELDIAAPGEKIRTSSFFGGSVVTHGTSIAVPHVVGVASLLWEKDLSKSHEFIRQLIDSTSKNISNSNKCGLIDADYAMSMYDTFAENFNEMKIVTGGIVSENTEVPNTFEEINDNEAYVEGRWVDTGHMDLIDKGAAFINYENKKAIEIMKAGIVYPDTTAADIKGYGAYPEYHGGVKWDKKNNETIIPVNFIACYELITRIAYKGGDTSNISPTKVKGLDRRVFDKIKSKISTTRFGGQTWDKILAKYGNTKTNRKYFLWGTSLHIVTDTFSHITWFKKNGIIGDFISHKKGADDPRTCSNRYKVAADVVAYSIGKLNTDLPGSFVDFGWGMDFTYNNTFVKNDLYKNFLACAGSDAKLKEELININMIKKATYVKK